MKIVAIVSVMTVALAGCGTESGDYDQKGQKHDDHGVSSTGTETSKAMPRVIVATENGVSIFDENLKKVTDFELTSRPSLTAAHDGRHVVANRQHDNESSIIDAGAWKQEHGDHFHFYTGQPALLKEVVKGNKPVHVVPNPQAGATGYFR